MGRFEDLNQEESPRQKGREYAIQGAAMIAVCVITELVTQQIGLSWRWIWVFAIIGLFRLLYGAAILVFGRL